MLDTRHMEERVATTPLMGAILALFSDGRKLKRGEAAKALSISERTFRANVAKLNELGYPIISEGNGFFMANTTAEIRNSKLRLIAERNSIDERIKSHDKMEEHLQRLRDGKDQLSFF
jgi:biotin operon repressor